MAFVNELEQLARITGFKKEEIKEESLETIYSNHLALAIDNPDLPELGLKSMIEHYISTRSWVKTLEECFEHDQDRSTQDILNLGEELSRSRKEMMELEMAIRAIDPTRLGFVNYKFNPDRPFWAGKTILPYDSDDIINGGMDDCREITAQFAVNTKACPLFCEWIKEQKIEPAVVGSGPEYYGKYHSYKSDYQIRATESNHISQERRIQIYQKTRREFPSANVEEDPENPGRYIHYWQRGYGPNIEAILDVLWRNEAKVRKEGRYNSGDYIYMSLDQLSNALDRWVKDNVIIKPRSPVFNIRETVIIHMKRKKIIDVKKINGSWYIAPVFSRLHYDLNKAIIDDFDAVSNKDVYLPIKYKHHNEWFSRIGILMNGQTPRLFYKDAKFEEEWTRKIKISESGTKITTEIMTKGGIPFLGSYQFNPDFNTDYDKTKIRVVVSNTITNKELENLKLRKKHKAVRIEELNESQIALTFQINKNSIYSFVEILKDNDLIINATVLRKCSYSPEWGDFLKTMFLNSLSSGKVKTCVKVEGPEDNLRYTSQAYKYYTLGEDDLLEIDPQFKRVQVIVPSTITDDELKKLGLNKRFKAKKIEQLENNELQVTFEVIKKSKEIRNFLINLSKSPLIREATLVIPKVLLFTDINKKPFYERQIGTSK